MEAIPRARPPHRGSARGIRGRGEPPARPIPSSRRASARPSDTRGAGAAQTLENFYRGISTSLNNFKRNEKTRLAGKPKSRISKRDESMRYMVLRALRRAGLEVSHVRPNLIDFLHSRSVDCVIDVGANVGQFGRALRNRGYKGRIISFEPISTVYQLLVEEAAGDALWETKNFAIGDSSGTAPINIGSNSALSSFLPVSELVIPNSVRSFRERSETVVVRTLDDFGAEVSGNVFLKSDTQGFERQVLEGAKTLLRRLCGVQLELPIVHLYQGTWTLPQAVEYMSKNGFAVSQIYPVTFLIRDNVSLQEVDAIFRRLDLASEQTLD